MDIKKIKINLMYESFGDYSLRMFSIAHTETATLAVEEVSRLKCDLIQGRDGA